MATVYPDSIVIEYHDGADWVDISSYVVSDIRGSSGFNTAGIDDRLATLGILEIVLNNADRKFTPYGGDTVHSIPTLTGWRKGARLRVRVVVGGKSHTLWAGYVSDIKSDDGLWGNRRAHVTATDWIDVSARYPMKGSDILTNQTIDSAATDLLTRLSIQPEATDFDAGDEIFPAVFSDVKNKTKAISELHKLLASELGYGYVKKDGTLRIENSTARRGTRALTEVSVHPSLLDTLELIDGDDFELIDGDLLLLDETETVQLSTTAERLGIETNNDQTLNSAFVKAYPVKIDTSLVVVFSLGQPLAIAAGQSVTFTGKYTNPIGGNPISATNLQTPVSTTDYLFNSLSDGTGTDLTADLTVTATYYGDLVDYVLANSSASLGYVTLLQARGYGIYFDSSIEGYVSDSDAIDSDGDYSATLDQKYKRDLYAGLAYAKSAVELGKNPKSRVVSARFLANLNEHHMMACMEIDTGSLISIYDNRSEMTKWHYIFSRAFVIALGGVMVFTFGLAEAPSIDSGGLNPVAIEFVGSAGKEAIDFGYIPALSNTYQRSISAWVYMDTSVSGGENTNIIAGMYTDTGGAAFYLGVAEDDRLRLGQGYSVARGNWQTGTSTVPTGQWVHVVATLDASNSANDPVLYIDGIATSHTENLTPSGEPADETGVPFLIGNLKTPTLDYVNGFDGKIKDVRVYSRILTQEEITELSSATAYASAVIGGLVFQGMAISADLGDAASLDGDEIPTGNNYFDNVGRFVGSPIGAPVIRE